MVSIGIEPNEGCQGGCAGLEICCSVVGLQRDGVFALNMKLDLNGPNSEVTPNIFRAKLSVLHNIQNTVSGPVLSTEIKKTEQIFRHNNPERRRNRLFLSTLSKGELEGTNHHLLCLNFCYKCLCKSYHLSRWIILKDDMHISLKIPFNTMCLCIKCFVLTRLSIYRYSDRCFCMH